MCVVCCCPFKFFRKFSVYIFFLISIFLCFPAFFGLANSCAVVDVCVTIPNIFLNIKFSMKYIKNYVPLGPVLRSFVRIRKIYFTQNSYIVDMDVCTSTRYYIINQTPFGLFTTPQPCINTYCLTKHMYKARQTQLTVYIWNNIKTPYRTILHSKWRWWWWKWWKWWLCNTDKRTYIEQSKLPYNHKHRKEKKYYYVLFRCWQNEKNQNSWFIRISFFSFHFVSFGSFGYFIGCLLNWCVRKIAAQSIPLPTASQRTSDENFQWIFLFNLLSFWVCACSFILRIRK